MRPGTLIRREAFSLRRYEQRLERSETTTSNSPGTTGMAATAHRAGDRGATGNGERLSEGGRNRRATAGCVGTATCGKTGQRGDHRVQRKPTGSYEQPQPRKPSY